MAEYTESQLKSAARKAMADGNPEAAKRFIDMARNAAPPMPERGFMKRTADWFAGNQKEDNIPLAQDANLQLAGKDAMRLTALLATTASDERLQSGIEAIIPDAQFRKDKFGNLVVVAPVGGVAGPKAQYTQFYPNPQGLDKTDMMIGSGAASLASIGAAVMPLITSATGLLSMGGLGVAEATIAEKLSSKLSNDDFDYTQPVFGFMGGAAGAKLAELAPVVFNLFKTKPTAAFASDGSLLPEVTEQLKAAGLDPESITKEAAQKFSEMTARGANATQAGRSAQASGLPVEIPLSRGEMTGDAGQMLLEDNIRKGVFGEQNAASMTGLRDRQMGAIQGNVPAMQSKLSGGAPPIEKLEGGRATSATLNAQRDEAYRGVNDAYAAARAGAPASIPPERAAGVARSMREAIEGYAPDSRGATDGIVNEINNILETTGDVRRLFEQRTRLVNAGDAGSSAQGAATAVKRALDKELGELADNAFLNGDEATVGLWTKAIKANASFKLKWDDEGILKAITGRKNRDGEAMALKVAPDDAVNLIFGHGATKRTARDLQVLKDQLPEAEWNMLRQEAFINLASDLSLIDGAPRGASFNSAWNKFRKNSPERAAILFSGEELTTISQLAAVASRVTNSTANHSNSANSAFNLVGKLAQAFGGTKAVQTAMMAPVLNTLKKMQGGAATVGAMNARPQAASTLAPRIGAGVGGQAAASPEGSNMIDRRIRQLTPFNIK